MPDEVKWLLPIVVGQSWPEGDEDAMRRMADAWRTAADGIDGVQSSANGGAQQVKSAMEGKTGEAFTKLWKDIGDGGESALPKLKEACEKLANSCDDAALDVEHTKLTIIASLIALAIQIAAMLAAAPATFGASTAGIAAAQGITRAVVLQIFKQLVFSILKNVAIEVATSVAIEFAVQGTQVAMGNRDGLDGGKFKEAAISGAIGGAVGGVFEGVGKSVGRGAGDAVGDAAGDAAGNAGTAAGRAAGDAAGDAAGEAAESAAKSIGKEAVKEGALGAAEGAVGSVAEQAIMEGKIDWGDVGTGAMSGGATGAGMGGLGAGKEHFGGNVDVPDTDGGSSSTGSSSDSGGSSSSDSGSSSSDSSSSGSDSGGSSSDSGGSSSGSSSSSSDSGSSSSDSGTSASSSDSGSSSSGSSSSDSGGSSESGSRSSSSDSGSGGSSDSGGSSSGASTASTSDSSDGSGGSGSSDRSSGGADSSSGGSSAADSSSSSGGSSAPEARSASSDSPSPTSDSGSSSSEARSGPSADSPSSGGDSGRSAAPSTSDASGSPSGGDGGGPSRSGGGDSTPSAGTSDSGSRESSGSGGTSGAGMAHSGGGGTSPSSPSGGSGGSSFSGTLTGDPDRSPSSPASTTASSNVDAPPAPAASGAPAAAGPAPRADQPAAGGPMGGVAGGAPGATGGGSTSSAGGGRPGGSGGWTGTAGTPGAAARPTGGDAGPRPDTSRQGPASRGPATPDAPSRPNTRPDGGVPQQRTQQGPSTTPPRPEATTPRPDAPTQRPDGTAPRPEGPGQRPNGSTPEEAGRPNGTSPETQRPDDGSNPSRPDHDGPDPHDTDGKQDGPDRHDDSDQHQDADPGTPERQEQIDAAEANRQGTPAGSSFHDDPNMRDLASRVPDDGVHHTVDVHALPDGRVRIGDNTFSAKEFADMLRRDPNFDGSKPVRLLSCDAGTSGLARDLANELGTPVTAPRGLAWTDGNGRVFASDMGPDGRPGWPPNGGWDTHNPDGTTTSASNDGFHPPRDGEDPGDAPDDAKARGKSGEGDWRDRPYEGSGRTPRDKVNDPDYIDRHYYRREKDGRVELVWRSQREDVDSNGNALPGQRDDNGALTRKRTDEYGEPKLDVKLVDGKPVLADDLPAPEPYYPKGSDSAPYPRDVQQRIEQQIEANMERHRREGDDRPLSHENRPSIAADADHARAQYDQAKAEAAESGKIQPDSSKREIERALDDDVVADKKYHATIRTKLGEETGEAVADRFSRDFISRTWREDANTDPVQTNVGSAGGRSGADEFDQIREPVDGEFLVTEAKGPYASYDDRWDMTGSRRVQQGHPAYFDTVLSKLFISDPELATRISLARQLDLEDGRTPPRVQYIGVQATIKGDSIGYQATEFDLDPPKLDPLRNQNDDAGER